MGRGIAKGPVPIEFYQQAFTVRQDGRMVWQSGPRSTSRQGPTTPPGSTSSAPGSQPVSMGRTAA